MAAGRSHKIKRFLLMIIITVLFLPMMQQQLRFIKEDRLHGAFAINNKDTFNLKNWFDGTYQAKYEKWLRDDIGFRHTLVRVRNQINYSCFGSISNTNITVGKEGYLYEPAYINAYMGKDYIGPKETNALMQKLKLLQDSLDKKNITLIVALAAGKASFFPEYLPDSCRNSTAETNYKAFAKSMKEMGIRHIDYNKWFMEQKAVSKYPLYPKTGIHWSNYGSFLALDSLIKFVERERKIDMPSLKINSIKIEDSLRAPDEDIGLTLNLLKPFDKYPMPVVNYSYEDSAGKTQPRLMAVSDSYFWQFFTYKSAPKSFSSTQFYYYNESIYNSFTDSKIPAVDQPGELEMEQNDVILIMATEANLGGLGWGFIHDAYSSAVEKKQLSDSKLVRYYENAIRRDKKWLMQVEEKARAKGLRIDEMIHLDAVYMAEQKK